MQATEGRGARPDAPPSPRTSAELLLALADPRQCAALREWTRLAPRGAPPQRRDFQPERVRAALPASVWLHVQWRSGVPHFEGAISGMLAANLFGSAMSGPLTQRLTLERAARLLPILAETAGSGTPALGHGAAATEAGAPFPFTRLVLPFAEPDGLVSRLLAVYGFEDEAALKLDAPLAVARDVPDRAGDAFARIRSRRWRRRARA